MISALIEVIVTASAPVRVRASLSVMAVASTTRVPVVLVPKLMATALSSAVTTFTSPVPRKASARVTVLLALVIRMSPATTPASSIVSVPAVFAAALMVSVLAPSAPAAMTLALAVPICRFTSVLLDTVAMRAPL